MNTMDFKQLTDLKTKEVPKQLIPALAKRWSPRAFDPKPLDEVDLNLLFEAARWAPSSTNAQPWRFLLARKGEAMHQRIVDILAAGNQTWAVHAPVLGMAWARTLFPGKDSHNRHALFDLGAAMQAMMTQATERGIYGHLMGGFDSEGFKALAPEQEPFEPGVCFALGYPGKADQLNEPFLSRELATRSRLPVSALVHGLEG